MPLDTALHVFADGDVPDASAFNANPTELQARIWREGLKPSVVTVSTAAITLSGTQTINGRAVADGESVLVAGQGGNITTIHAANGLYTASSGAWVRRNDANATSGLADAAAVMVSAGTYAGQIWWLVTPSVTPGTTAHKWAAASDTPTAHASTHASGGTDPVTLAESQITNLGTDLAAKQATSGKDATGGYAGLTLFKINFKNALNTFTSFFTNANTAARTYTFQDRDGTIADNTDLALKAPLANPALTGTPTAPTAAPGTNSTQLATTAYVDTADFAPLASPAFTGTPTAPTESPGDSSTVIATTEFVTGALAAHDSSLIIHTYDASNTSTTETTLYNDTIVANKLSADGALIFAVHAGLFAGSINNKRIKLKFAGTTIFDTGSLAISTGASWQIDTILIRSGTTTARASCLLTSSSTVLSASATETDLTGLDFTLSNDLLLTGQGGASTEVTGKLVRVGYAAAP